MFRGGFIRRPARWLALVIAGRRMAKERGFRGSIHRRDHLMQYFLTSSAPGVARGPAAGLGEYFDSGARDADQVVAVMRELGHGRTAKVLEFASGYGRVTRHLKLDNLTACDIHPEAVSFLRSKLKVSALQSSEVPAGFDPGERYDFIFVLSLFSHLPDDLFGPWLAKLGSLLAPGGHLMFTTYGVSGAAKAPLLAGAIDQSAGLTFFSHTDQPDLGAAIYGTAVVTQDYVREKIAAATSGRIVSRRECAWWQIQDEWIVAAAGAESVLRSIRTIPIAADGQASPSAVPAPGSRAHLPIGRR